MRSIKIFIIILISISLLGFNNMDILDEDNPKWNMDSDKDGLPDAFEEIIGTSINNKDQLEQLDRYKLSDHYINENDKDKINVEVTDYTLLQVSAMASEKLYTDPVGKTVKDVFGNKYDKLSDFKIVRYEDGRNGFGGIALKLGNSLIVGYKPTRNYKDWLENFTIQFRPHPQRKYAIEFIKPLANKDDEIYITGHSLGGLLAQYATYYLHNEGYENIKTVTFNSANNFNPKHMKGEFAPPIIKKDLKKDYTNSYLNSINKENNALNIDISYLVGFLNKSIKENGFIDVNNKSFINSDFKEYNNIVTNYIVSNDPLYLAINGGYLGTSKIIQVQHEDLDIIKDKDKLNKYHSLDTFMEVLKDK